MAKKKKAKESEKKKNTYITEVYGIIVFIIGILGICRFGMVGRLFGDFAMFITGRLYAVFLVFLSVIGAYIIVKRESPKFFGSKLIGFYTMMITFLAAFHLTYITESNYRGFKIFEETINNSMLAFKSPGLIEGGGIIGAFFSWGFYSLFDYSGTIIILCVLILFSVILMFNVSIFEIVKWIFKKFKGFFMTVKEINVKEAEENYEKNGKVIISSIDELKQINGEQEVTMDEVKEEVLETPNIYKIPSLNLLTPAKKDNNASKNEEELRNVAVILEKTLLDFGIEGRVVHIQVGPSVTQYEVELKSGTKVNRILGISREIALALAAKDVRIQAPIPGKGTVGVEIPNKNTTTVWLREVLEAAPTTKKDSKLLAALGKDIMGNPIFVEINQTPHLLVAGATGSGKSVCINSIIISLLMRTKPDEVKLVLVDPKRVELSIYNGAPHLLGPVVTDPKKASIALQKLVQEMENRYVVFSDAGVKNIAGYNAWVENKNRTNGESIKLMPYIVAIVDELADLMLVAAKEVEDSILRITQMARAAGIHLIVATQRPSTDVITGLIKSNIPSRIAFSVSSGIDSRTILDSVGAEKLLGKGDMLFSLMGDINLTRVQGTWVSEEEIKKIVDYTTSQHVSQEKSDILKLDEPINQNHSYDDETEEYDDPRYNEIVEFVITSGKASASLIQRKFRLGYNRAARIIDLLEERGIIGPQNGSKPREVLVRLEDSEE